MISFRLAATLSFALLTASATPSLAQTKTLMVAEPGHNVGYLPLYVAIRNNYFSDVGLDVKVLTMESGSSHTNAVLSGQAFAFIGGPEHNRGNVYYMAAPGKGPKPGESIDAYFKGKIIAVSSYGGTPNSITRYLLKKWKLDAKTDVTLQELPSSAVPAAMKTGKADIGVGGEPFITQGIKQGFWSEPFYNIPKELGPYAYSTINVRLDTIQKDPDTVQKFVAAMVKGLEFTYAHPDDAAAVARKEFPTMNLDDLKATLDRYFADKVWTEDGSITRDSWETAKSVVMGADLLKKDVAYDEIIDMSFFDKVKKTN
jgi:NitT/TauT family transport system substrate-binding protein